MLIVGQSSLHYFQYIHYASPMERLVEIEIVHAIGHALLVFSRR